MNECNTLGQLLRLPFVALPLWPSADLTRLQVYVRWLGLERTFYGIREFDAIDPR